MGKTHLNQQDAKNSILKKVATWVIVIAVVVFLVGMTAYNYITDSGILTRGQVAMETENYSVTVPEMTYYFYSIYQNLVSTYTSYGLTTSTLGLDTTQSLKNQSYIFGDGTWYDYIIEQTEASVESILTACEAARAAGLTLDEDDMKTLNDTMDSMREAAKEQSMSLKEYIKSCYGSVVRQSDVESAIELSLLATKFTEKVTDDADVSDEALESEYEANTETYDKVSYLSYTFYYDDYMPEEEEDETAETSTDDETEEDTAEDESAKADAIADIAKYSEELAKCSDVESFEAYIQAHLTDVLGEATADALETATSLETKYVTYSESEQLEWAFEAEVGDINTFVEDDGETITVILMTRAKGRVEEITYRDVRHILFLHDNHEDGSKAQEVYDQWIADGASVEDFITLAEQYSEDPGSNTNGGLYEDVAEDEMVTEFNDWLFDPEREEGDHALIEAEDTGWHIMYYAGGSIGWKTEAKLNLQDAAVSAATEEALELYEVTINQDGIDSIVA